MEKKNTVEVGKAISFGWDTLKKNFWYLIGVFFLFMILGGIVQRTDNNFGVGGILSLAISVWLTCGLLKLSLGLYNNKKLPIEDFFTQFKYFWRVLGSTILVGLIVVFGLCMLIVPGIYFALKYKFTEYLIVDQDLGIVEAMQKSAELTQGIKLRLFVFSLASLGVLILGVLALGVGIIVAIPVIWLATTYIYKNLHTVTVTAEPEKA